MSTSKDMAACAVKANNAKRFNSLFSVKKSITFVNLIKLEGIWKCTRKLILLHAILLYLLF